MSLYSDLPITKKEQDAFGRTKFIDDLTSFIEKQGVEPDERKQEHRSISDNLVIGVYGPWGSGKTSVVNCVQDELNNKGFDTIYFNPWRYKDEDLLLMDLFKLIASKVNKHLDDSMKAEFSKFLLKYSKYLVLPKISFGGVEVDAKDTARAALEGLGDFLKDGNTLDDYKNKINGFLGELKKPIVVFVDDIDRLDKHEVQLVFKTIKLTAAFSNIIYVLSFDDEMVAKSIGENYGEGREKDGKDFIEKIVQVPLRLPSFLPSSIYSYLVKYPDLMPINDVKRRDIDSNGMVSFGRTYYLLITTFINTPRDAKRYLNSLAFLLPSLHKVSRLDILILEIFRLKLPGTFKELVKINSFLNNAGLTGGITLDSFRKIVREEIFQYTANKVDEIQLIKDAMSFLFGMNLITSELLLRNYSLDKHDVTDSEDKNQRIIDNGKFNEYLRSVKPYDDSE